MKRRRWDQLAAGVSLLLLGILAAGTWYLAMLSARNGAGGQVRTPPGEPDYFLEDAVFTRVGADGEPAYRIATERLLHFPEDGSSTWRLPVLISVDPRKPHVTVHADQGHSNADGSHTVLTGNVVLVRAAMDDEPEMTIRTEKVSIDSATGIARSDRAVRIERGHSVLTGTGMEFDNTARTLKVDADVVLTLQPAPGARR